MTHEKQELVRSIKVIFNILKNSSQVTCKHHEIGGSHYFQFERHVDKNTTTTLIFDCRDTKDGSGMVTNEDYIKVEVAEELTLKGISYHAESDVYIPDQILAHLRTHMRVPLEGIREVNNYLLEYTVILHRYNGVKTISNACHVGPLSLIPYSKFSDKENKSIDFGPPPTIAYNNIYKIYLSSYDIANHTHIEYD